MPSSEARQAADPANALRSTGPTPEGGEAPARADAPDHGPAGAAIVLPGEDAAEADRRFAAISREIGPRCELTRLLAHRVAALTVRLERSVRHEAALLAERVRHAAEAFDDARADAADHLIAWIASEPPTFRRKLERTPEGCDRLIWALRGLRADLMRGGAIGDGDAAATHWSSTHGQKFDEYLGRRDTDFPASRCHALTRALLGDPAGLCGGEAAGLDAAPLRAWARDRLAELIDDEVARLEAHAATLDRAAIDADRRQAGDRALFDPSPAAALARKYEAATERQLIRAIREIRQIDAPAPAAAPADRPPEPRPQSPRDLAIEAARAGASPLGSFFPGRAEPPARPPAADGSRPPGPAGANLPAARAGFARVAAGNSIILPPRG